MKNAKIITPDGLEHRLNEVDFEPPEEDWKIYKLKDGTLMKFRTTVLSVAKSDKFDEMGNPFYFVNSQNQMRTYCPDEIKGEPSKRIKEPKEIDIMTQPKMGYR